MSVRIAINGFGRIGRLCMRALHESKRRDLELVALNNSGEIETHAHLLRYDATHGPFPGEVKVRGKSLLVGGREIPFFAERDPARLPWAREKIDIVWECTGSFTSSTAAAAHIAAGAKRVLISAPAAPVDATIVYGVNHDKLEKSHQVVSAASCTTNCLAPMAAVLHDSVGIEQGIMTTIHSYTGDQPVLDRHHKDIFRARAAAQCMVPTTTGAAKALGCVLPELKGRLDGWALRVPTPNVSLVDLKFTAARATDCEEINELMRKAAKGRMKNIIAYDPEPKVSIDFNHDSHSCCFAPAQTRVVNENLVQAVGWYDNEWGFSCRMLDLAQVMGAQIRPDAKSRNAKSQAAPRQDAKRQNAPLPIHASQSSQCL